VLKPGWLLLHMLHCRSHASLTKASADSTADSAASCPSPTPTHLVH
jgi:hypothetical protein